MRESKNLSDLGKRSEQLVVQYFAQQGFKLIFKNLKHLFAEIDLIVLSPAEEIYLVEVKTVAREMVWQTPIAKKQKKKIENVFLSMQRSVENPLFLKLAIVTAQKGIEVFDWHDVT